MPEPESLNLVTYIDDLTAATREGSVEWSPSNPTTFIWDTPAKARVSLQRVESSTSIRVSAATPPQVIQRRTTWYVLQAFEALPGRPLLLKVSMDGSKDQNLNTKLNSLFETIKSETTRKSLEFLRELLPPRSPSSA